MGTNSSASPKLDIMSILKSDIDVVFGEGGVYTTEPHVTGILLYPPPAPRLLLFWVKKTPGLSRPRGGVFPPFRRPIKPLLGGNGNASRRVDTGPAYTGPPKSCQELYKGMFS